MLGILKFQRRFVYDPFVTIIITSGWPGIYHASVDSTHVGEGPSADYRPAVAIYYVLYFIIFPFFFINVFVALIVITYTEASNDDVDVDRY